MSLFCGNISKYVKLSELEKEFEKFGRCQIRQKVGYYSPPPQRSFLCACSPL